MILTILCMGDGIQHPPRPVVIVRMDHNDTEAVRLSFHLDTLRIINVQINTKCRRKFRWQV